MAGKGRKPINDGLTKYQRYRLKNLDEFRRKKREYAKTPAQRQKRAEYQRAYRAKHREKTNEQAREYRKRKQRQRTPEMRHNEHLKRTYGLSRNWYLVELEKQGGRCAICGSETARWKKRFHVDHCHESGKIRGLLCNRCNPMLGWFEAYKEKIMKYIDSDPQE